MSVLTHTHTRTHTATIFADPYKKCLQCDGWIDGVLNAPGPLILVPCEHRANYRDVCPSWSPVDGCGCADYSRRHPEDAFRHDMRPPTPGDGKVY